MNQFETGAFIARKRKEKNLTQEGLAEKIGVSNKTVSKWETGRCMPDYSVIQQLCKELHVTLAELMNAEEAAPDSLCIYDEQILDLLRRTQNLENQRVSLYGVILLVMGIALAALSCSIGGSALKDFFSGLMIGLSVGEMLAGIYIIAKGFSKQK